MSDDHDHMPFATDLHRLLEENAEIFILGIEVFRTAVSALFSQDPLVAQFAIQMTDNCAARINQLRRETVGVLAQWTPKGAALQQILRIERTAAESMTISQCSRDIADHALALQGAADQHFALVHQRAAEVFLSLVQQIYFGLRGCLALTSTRDRALAERVIAEDGRVHQLQQMLSERIQQIAFAVPQHATELRHLGDIVEACRQIGMSIVAVCRDALATPHYVRSPSLLR
jgi:hypothetical protein